MSKVQSEDKPTYEVEKFDDDGIIATAISIIEHRFSVQRVEIINPASTKEYLILKLAERKSECFCVMFLDSKHRVIAFDEMFQGTIDGASVHPREVVRAALERNAAAVILAHNHPSGVPEPSQADKDITEVLKKALALIGTRILDHLIVGGAQVVSLAERGLVWPYRVADQA